MSSTKSTTVSAVGRYKCTLNDDLLAKAQKELNEPIDNTARLHAIDEFLAYFKVTFPESPLKDQSDRFLLKFLRVGKFNKERASKVMNRYVNRREVFKEVFEKVDHPHLIVKFIESHYLTVLRGHAHNGSSVVLLRPTFGLQKVDVLSMFAGVIISMERLLDIEENQINGVMLIEDLHYVNLSMAKQMSPGFAKRVTSIMQECLPIRLKNICMVNESWVFSLVFSIVSNFLKPKLRERIMLIGKNYEKLHALVPPEMLPEAYGGVKKEVELNHKNWVEIMIGSSTLL